MTLRNIASVSCTNLKVYIGHSLVYSPSKGTLAPFLNRKVLWLDSENDIIVVGIEEGEKHEEE